MKQKNRIPVIPPHILWRIDDGKAVLFDEVNGEPYLLNETGTTIWLQCVAQQPVREMIHWLQAEYDAPASVIEKDVITILAEFRKKGVLHFQHAS